MSGDRTEDDRRSRGLAALKEGVAFVLFGSLFVAVGGAVLYGTLAVVGSLDVPGRPASLAALVAFVACVAGGTYLLVALDRR
jgi:hypothetical protein